MTNLNINLDYLHNNITNIISYKKGFFMFVLKANAYGHGYKMIANELENYDRIKFIAVATPKEAIYLNRFTTKKTIILGYTPDSLINQIIKENIIPTISTLLQAKLIQNKSNIFINVDSGFHRLGQPPIKAFKNEIIEISKLDNINILGIFTHLKLISKESDLYQIDSFERFIKNLNIPYTSISDSIGYTRYSTQENLFRIGALIYGLTSENEYNKIKVLPTTSLKTNISRIEKINKNDSAFYNSFVKKGMKIATIQIGYADGLFRNMHKDSYVLINNKKCKYIEVGMDQSIIDITDVLADINDEVIIFGEKGISLEKLSKINNTNKNNLLTMISNRVTRTYYKNNKIFKVINNLEINYEY